MINERMYTRSHADVVAMSCGTPVRVIAFQDDRISGPKSVLGTGATTARSGSSGWSPPS